MSEFWHLMGDPAHWGFEAVTDLVFAGLGLVVGRFWLRAHDRKHHS